MTKVRKLAAIGLSSGLVVAGAWVAVAAVPVKTAIGDNSSARSSHHPGIVIEGDFLRVISPDAGGGSTP